MKKHLVLVLVLGLVWLSYGCAVKRAIPISEEDSPAHHYLMGMELIDKQDLPDGLTQFERALELKPDYAPALAGKALIAAMTTEAQADEEHKSVDLKQAMDLLDNAYSAADGDSQKYSVRVTGIRVCLHARPKKWLKKAQGYYGKAIKLQNDVKPEELPYYRTIAAADYFMGIAFFKAYCFRDSENALAKVLSTPPDRWHEPAKLLYKRVQKITRACANFTLTDVAKRIAVKDRVVRADVAALLVDEIHLDRFLAGRIPVASKEPKASFIPADVDNHLFKSEILTVLKWHLRGLEPLYDKTSRAYLFYPDKPITRKELALVLEDLLIKMTGDKSLATKYFGQKNSPYPDVSPTSSYFNAVMNVVSRGLMEPDLSGEFRPDDFTDGAEVLLAILRLRDVMNIY
ncbi:MAG: S-layer homology domain-containing protein [Nitrospiraceae bacterium]|nr:S-layer homology domain-containing protein [Nitrospiraceae bacterium]